MNWLHRSLQRFPRDTLIDVNSCRCQESQCVYVVLRALPMNCALMNRAAVLMNYKKIYQEACYDFQQMRLQDESRFIQVMIQMRLKSSSWVHKSLNVPPQRKKKVKATHILTIRQHLDSESGYHWIIEIIEKLPQTHKDRLSELQEHTKNKATPSILKYFSKQNVGLQQLIKEKCPFTIDHEAILSHF